MHSTHHASPHVASCRSGVYVAHTQYLYQQPQHDDSDASTTDPEQQVISDDLMLWMVAPIAQNSQAARAGLTKFLTETQNKPKRPQEPERPQDKLGRILDGPLQRLQVFKYGDGSLPAATARNCSMPLGK
jgi:hypothetical protein